MPWPSDLVRQTICSDGLSRQNVGSNTGSYRRACDLDRGALLHIASLHPGVVIGTCEGSDGYCV